MAVLCVHYAQGGGFYAYSLAVYKLLLRRAVFVGAHKEHWLVHKRFRVDWVLPRLITRRNLLSHSR